MGDNKLEYQSGPTVAQRATIYIDVNIDTRARSTSYLNAYASKVGSPVVAVDSLNGTTIATSSIENFNNINGAGSASSPGNGSGGSGVNTTTPPYISVLPPTNVPPLAVTNLVATRSGENIILTFNWDPSDNANVYIDRFLIQIHDSSIDKYYYLNGGYGVTPSFLDNNSASQTLNISSNDLNLTGIELISNINSIGIATADVLNKGPYVTATVAAFVSPLPQPVFTLSHGTDYYLVTLDPTNLTSALSNGFYGFIVEENVTAETNKSSVSLTTGWVQAAPLSTTSSPLVVYAPNDAHRWVRLKYISKNGLPSIYSDILDVTPDAFIPVNTSPPTQFTSASIAWAGNDIVVTFAQPASNQGTTVKVKLVPYVNGVESTSLYSYYYHVIVGTETSFTIKSLDLYGQFGTYYSKFKGYITSVSNQGIETLGSIINSGPVTRTTSLTGVTPNITVNNTTNGYAVQFDLGSSGANYAEVYQYYITPSFTNIALPDYLDGTSSGTNGTNTITMSSITLQNGSYTIPAGHTLNEFIGIGINGNGIAPNTYVTNISGSGPYILTLSQNINTATYGNVSGNYHMQALVYSGSGPASVFLTYYNDLYVTAVFYDNYGNNSNASSVKTVHPINPSQSLISDAVQVGGSAGAIYVGPSASTGARILLGVDSYYNTNNNSYSGIFAYDGSATANSAPTTSIISNASNGGYTFATTNAKIADWSISSSQIQNTLGTSSNYVGISATGTYSFWAGSTTSGGDANAKFSVTPAGKVSARDIRIYGSGNSTDTLLSAGSNFTVKGDGSITASNADLSGKLTVNQQSYFNANVNIANGSYLISAGTGTVKIGAEGLLALNSSSAATTKIYSNPITVGATTGISLWSSKALFGSSESTGWLIVDGVIKSNNITIDSTNQYFRITSSTSNSTNGIILIAGTDTDRAIAVGKLTNGTTLDTSSAYFSVTHSGIMTANSAIINGSLSGGKTSISDTSHSGYYFDIGGSAIIGAATNAGPQAYFTPTGISLSANNVRQAVFSGNVAATNNSPLSISGSSVTGYSGTSQIQLTGSNVLITGLPIQGDMDNQYSLWYNNWITDSTHGYLNVYGQGPVPRQRALVEDPVSGVVKAGFAVYYQDSSVNKTAPGSTSGYVGDLWVQY
jgi:hypothetical protein